MKFLRMSAVALAFAAPAAAQTASNAQAHAGYAQHQMPQPGTQTGTQPAAHAEHAQHSGHGGSVGDRSKHANCCGDAKGTGRMDCCEGAQAAQRPCCEQHAASGQGQTGRPAPSN